MSGYTLSMSISPGLLFEHIGLTIAGSTPWGTVHETNRPGIYAVSMNNDPWDNSPHPGNAPISEQLVAEWIDAVPTFALRGSFSPRPRDVVQTLERFWLNDETVIYIGKATSLQRRLSQFYRHKLGRRRPHAGGHWLKALDCLSELFVHYAEVVTAADALLNEDAALNVFKNQVSDFQRDRLENPIPFANLEHPKGGRKQTEIKGSILPYPPTTLP